MNTSRHLGYVPIQLIQYCLKKNLENTLRVYLALKYADTNGIMQLNKGLEKEFSEWLEITPRTLKNQLKRLEELKWIGKSKNHTLFVRGYGQLKTDISTRYKTRLELHSNYLLKENFKAYLIGAVIGFFVKLQRAKMYLTGSKKAGSQQLKYTPYPLSLRYLNRMTGKNHRELIKHIDKAVHLGYVSKHPKIKELDISCSQISAYLENYPSQKAHPQCIRGKVYLRYPDHFIGNLKYQRDKWKK